MDEEGASEGVPQTLGAPKTEFVSLLFTDIETSTRMWDEDAEGMRELLERHDQLLRESIVKHGGNVFKTVGDAFRASFVTPQDATRAAVGGQEVLKADAHLAAAQLRVRMAIHCGAVSARDGDFFGPPLNRCARIEELAHGGQTLVSQAAAEALLDELPAGVALLDLGEHRLRDLRRTERLFQIQHPSLPSKFPPLNSLDNLPHNLPIRRNRFVGRAREISDVAALVRRTRLLTLTGPGGTGKTRLAQQAAAGVLDEWPDGVWLADMGPLSDGGQVVQAVANAVNISERPGQLLSQTLLECLSEKRLLLLLDNCEHVIDDCAMLADLILTSCRCVTILATSRQTLGIEGEQTWLVPAMQVPDQTASAPHSMEQADSVQLFLERAQAASPGFELVGQTAVVVADICRRLDGIPLAIELAAVRTRMMSVEVIAERLNQRFRLLTGGGRTALPRQQTLRATMDWSYALLRQRERVAFERLCVFAGGWTLDAAEVVCAADDIEESEVLDLMTQLVDKSLVSVDGSVSSPRYHLLQTVRQYGLERLVASEMAEAPRDRHLTYFLALAERSEPGLSGPEQSTWLTLLDEEHDNIRSALDWACAGGEADPGLRLAAAMTRYWSIRGGWQEGRARLEQVLQLPVADRRTAVRADALHAAGNLAWFQGDFTTSRRYHEESLSIRRELGDRSGIAASLNNLGNLAYAAGDLESARTLFEESLAESRVLDDGRVVAGALGNIGNVAMRQGDLAAALECHDESLAIRRQLGDEQGAASSLVNLGNVARRSGDPTQACTYYEDSLATRRQLGDQQGIAITTLNLSAALLDLSECSRARECAAESLEVSRRLGDLAGTAGALVELGSISLAEGDLRDAARSIKDGAEICSDLGDMQLLAHALEELAQVAASSGDVTCTARLIGAAQSLREQTGIPPTEIAQNRVAEMVSVCRRELGDVSFEAEAATGRRMSVAELTDCPQPGPDALSGAPPEAAPAAPHEAQPDASSDTPHDAPHNAQPDAPHEAQPDAPHSAQPGAPHNAQPDAPHDAQPDAP